MGGYGLVTPLVVTCVLCRHAGPFVSSSDESRGLTFSVELEFFDGGYYEMREGW